ncbi:hypothetical protein [Xanthocytophaga agilis]|uniref:Uncharacterized protein n=1 Tax=Xanthocytophaga agilis TaxID=3048010 RepID=A0AAE3RDB4_9BACT|nr:hypothetical protein [Xanthocytophaga agilis]MDJ1506284.1 hypothetical protein [Xanthocytophaga agilis]
MKWTISAYSKLPGNPTGHVPFLERELQTYLVTHDYQLPYNSKQIISEAKVQYEYVITNRQYVMEIEIHSSTWKPFVNREYPQIVVLIEDFFKLSSNYWYYLETLTPTESEAIELLGRTIEPLMIKERIDQVDLTIPPIVPHIEVIGIYYNQQTDIYSGTSVHYKDVTDFWISYIAWISNGQVEQNNLALLQNATYFNSFFYGSCIPVPLTEVAGKIVEIQHFVKDFDPNAIKGCLLMRKDWYDNVYLFDLGSKYIVHNWWTGE